MIEVELPDGRILEFPEGTSQDVMRSAVQSLLGSTTPSVEQPTAGPERTLGQAIYENVVGSGEVDTPGERIGQAIGSLGRTAADTAASAGAGVARGAAELVGLPGTLGDLMDLGLEKVGVIPEGSSERTQSPLSGAALRDYMSSATGGATEYVGEGVPQRIAGTVGEFIGGGAGAKVGTIAGAGSELAGMATEGTAAEPYARVAGGLFAPTALKTANKTVNEMFKRSVERPSLETLKGAKNAAYKAVEAAGETLPASVADDIATRARAAAANQNYVEGVDAQTKAALAVLDRQVGKELTIGQLDKLRQGLNKRYNAAQNEVAILDMIKIVDDAIDAAPGGELMSAARLANTRYKKAEILDKAFEKAADQTASTGSGGNTVNKFRQAVSNVINDPRKARSFDQAEIDLMRKFIQGDFSENILRRIGKLSPSGNGLMLALQTVGGVVSSGATLPLMLVGEGASQMATRRAVQGAESIKDMAATGALPAARGPMLDKQLIRTAPGLLAQ